MMIQLYSTFYWPSSATQLILVGCVSYGSFGMYLANFALAMWSSGLTGQKEDTVTQRRVRFIAWLTAGLIVLRQGIITMWMKGQLCTLQTISPNSCNQLFASQFTFSLPLIVNAYIPPLVALLSDTILAWRVYVIWHQPRWLLYFLGGALAVDCALGLATAIWLSVSAETAIDLFAFYQAWAWVAFVVNSTFSLGILIRIRLISDVRWHGNGVHVTLLKGLIESAVISWLATLSCAVVWSTRSQTDYQGTFPSLAALTDTPLERFGTAIFFALPSLLGISQVLIITRVNISKFETTLDLNQTITALAASHWDAPETDVDDDLSMPPTYTTEDESSPSSSYEAPVIDATTRP